MAAIVNEPEFRGWIQRSLDTLLRDRGFKSVDTPDWFKSANLEGPNRFGKNGWFDYIRELPDARYLILELKVCENGVLRAFDDSQHLLHGALEICGVPVQYSWNNIHERDARDCFFDETLLDGCEAQPPSRTTKNAPAPNRDLKSHVLGLLQDSAGSTGDIWLQPLPFLGLLAQKNAATVLVSIAMNDLSFSINQITPAFVAQIEQDISQVELSEDWKSLGETDLAAQLCDAFGALLNTDIPTDGSKNDSRKLGPRP